MKTFRRITSRTSWLRRVAGLPAPLVPAGAWLHRQLAWLGRSAKGRRRDAAWYSSAMRHAGCRWDVPRVAGLHAQAGALLRLVLCAVATRRDAAVGRLATFRGLDNVHAALSGNRGVVLAGSHIGLGAIPAAWLVHEGIAVHTLRRREQAAREGHEGEDIVFFGAERIWYGEGDNPAAFLKRGLKCLAGNHAVSYLVDGPLGERGLTLPVFGREVFLRTGAMELARIGRAPLVFAFGLMDDTGRAVVEYLEPITLETQADVEKAARAFVEHYEERVRRWPWNCTRAHMDRFIFTGENAEFHAPRPAPLKAG